MKLQIASQLAIFSILELVGEPDRQTTVADIGAKYGISTNHLAKVMNVLGRAGLVRSVRGAGGGFQFCGNARRTTILDVIEGAIAAPRADLSPYAPRIVSFMIDPERIRDVIGPGGKQIQLEDPDGNPIELFEPAR